MRTTPLATTLVLASSFCSSALAQQPAPPAKPHEKPADAPANKAAESTVAGPSLNIGDAAPKLYIEKWLKGEAVASFEHGKVYVVEFWATWCPPCLASIPHLSKLQKEYADKGLTIIGISSDEENGLATVEPFVKKQGTKMAYTVAWDDAGRTNTAWMQAAAQQGIPHAFIIDREGKLAFHGHPMAIDEPLSKIIDGTWDMQAAKQRAADERELLRLQARYQELASEGQWSKAVAELSAGIDARPALAVQLASVIYSIHAIDLQDIEAANAFAQRIITTTSSNDADALNALAWTIADLKDEPGRDLSLALSAAKKADALRPKDAAILDTLAFAHAAVRNWPAAIAAQEQAVAATKDDETKERYTQTLARYRRQGK